jgi:hypothetical protein
MPHTLLDFHSYFHLCLQVGAVVVGFDSRANYCKVIKPAIKLVDFAVEGIRSGIFKGLCSRISEES